MLVLVLAPTSSADSASFSGSAPCLVGGVQLLVSSLPGCSLSQSGTVTFVACHGSQCSFDVSVTTTLAGAPAGWHEASARADDGDATSLVCSSLDVSLAPGTSCSGTRTVTLEFTEPCRFVSVYGAADVDVRATTSTFVTTFAVCITATGATFTF